jgi:hypothetical protein
MPHEVSVTAENQVRLTPNRPTQCNRHKMEFYAKLTRLHFAYLYCCLFSEDISI